MLDLSYSGGMTTHQNPETGDRVRFVGFNPRTHETVGIVTDVLEGQMLGVLWSGSRQGYLHVSQVEVY